MPQPPEALLSPTRAARLPADVRTIALVGPAGAGKTTLLQALLVRTGALPQDRRDALDADDAEVRRGRTVRLAAAAVEHRGRRLNLLDTPGSPDFEGALRAGLRAADAALFVVPAVGGLDPRTAGLWQDCAAAGLPRAVVVTQLDRPGADFDESVALAQRLLGEGVHPLHVPMHGDHDDVAGLIDLLRLRVSDWSGGDPVERDPDPEHLTLVEGVRGDLLEAVLAESDDPTLLDRYLDDDELDPALLTTAFDRAVAGGHLHPVLAVSPRHGVGTAELLDLLAGSFPSPLEHPGPPVSGPDGSPAEPLTCDPDGRLVAEVLAAREDSGLGRLCLVRVRSGTLRPELPVRVTGRQDDAAQEGVVGALRSPLGALLLPMQECGAGDVCVVAGLHHARAGDTLSCPDLPLLLAPWQLPEPQHPVAVTTAHAVDQPGLAAALSSLAAEDPTLRVEQRAETGQLLLWCLGEGHAELLLEQLRDRSGLTVDTPEVQDVHGGSPGPQPWSAVEVDVPAAFVAPVRRDLARRGVVTGSEDDPDHPDRVTVRAEVADAALAGWATALRELSRGTGSARRRPLGDREP